MEVMIMSATLKFGGKTYYLWGASKTKEAAAKYAASLRRNGHLARVVKVSGQYGWATYATNKVVRKQ